MTRWITIALAVLIVSCALPGRAQDDGADWTTTPRSGPELTGFMMTPTSTDTCNPVRFTFAVTNYGRTAIISQSPFSEFIYPLYSSFWGLGLRSPADRYMIGLSLDGGRDGYPFRWGFPGRLLPGRSLSVSGFIAIPQVGSFGFTPVLLRGDRVISRFPTRTATAVVNMCRPFPVPRQGRVVIPPIQPIYPPVSPFYDWTSSTVFGPGNYTAFVPYTVDGHLLVSAAPFLYTLGAELIIFGGQIIINKPGIHLVLAAGSPYGILNGVPIFLPSPPLFFGGVPYIPPQFISPILGATVFRDPYTGILYIRGPAGF